MLTDWLIYLDYLEENNYNTSFLRLITPITFGIIVTNYYKYNNGNGYGNGNGIGFGYGYGYGYGYGNGSGFGYCYAYSNSYDEEH